MVEALDNHKNGKINSGQLESILSNYRSIDIRNDYDKYVHQNSLKQQYHLSLSGGGDKNTYFFSAGADRNKESRINQGFDRVTINTQNTYNPISKLELSIGLNYSNNTTKNLNLANLYEGLNGVNYNYQRILPYSRLVDDTGNPTAIRRTYRSEYINEMEARGFLDWNLRPLEEIRLADDRSKINNILFRAGLKYKILPFVNIETVYQNEQQTIANRNHQSIETYYVRDLINRFAQYNELDGTIDYIVPKGGILNIGNSTAITNNIRGQLNYNQSFVGHQVDAIAGVEVREMRSTGNSSLSYGYDDQFGIANMGLDFTTYFPTNPSGSSLIEAPYGGISGYKQRFISYYFNGGYAYLNKYLLNFSARKDGSNFFGSNVNKRFTPLWSIGAGWNISNEQFYQSETIPYLKLRASYGYNGNFGNIASQLTGRYWLIPALYPNEYLSNLTAPNNDLSWERVKNINIGIDFSTKSNILNGTIEYFNKDGIDLLQPTPLAPQTGFLSYTSNAASTKSKGFDITLRSQNINRLFKWSSTLLFSTISDKIVAYDREPTANSIQASKALMLDKPMYSIFSYRWAGLDPENGDPQGFLNGEVSKDYNEIINNYAVDSLNFHGTSRPKHYGTLRNDFTYKGFSLSVNIAFKLAYFYRNPTTSLNYTDILTYGQYQDFADRWQNPGDELHTSVPSLSYPGNSSRNTFYKYSEVLVERADHIRLQDIRIAYNFPKNVLSNLKIDNLSIYTYLNNLGILWRANNNNIDPDVNPIGGTVFYSIPFSFATGITIGF